MHLCTPYTLGCMCVASFLHLQRERLFVGFDFVIIPNYTQKSKYIACRVILFTILPLNLALAFLSNRSRTAVDPQIYPCTSNY